MNPPKSRWLRMRSLLLLAPLLVAATPSSQPLATDQMLGFDNTPLEVKPGQCVPITVQTRTLGGTVINLGTAVLLSLSQEPILGTFSSTSQCSQGSTTTDALIPAGATSTTVFFQPTETGRVTLKASTLQGLLPGLSRPISVVTAFTRRLEVTSASTRLRPGASVDVTVRAVDEFGEDAVAYTGQVALSSNLPILDPPLPMTLSFGPLDSGRQTVSLILPALGDYQLKVQDQVNTSLQAQSPTISVLYPRVSVVPTRKAPGTCEPTTFELQVVDDQGQPSQELATVRMCRPSGSTVKLFPTQPGDDLTAECAIRILQGAPAHVTWISTDAQDVSFELKEAQPVGDLAISWKRLPSLQYSSIAFGAGGPQESTLTSYSGQLPIRFELKDTCNKPLVPQEKTVSFVADKPLFVSPLSQLTPGVWTASVALAGCPADTSRLYIRPAFDGAVIAQGPGGNFELSVLPTCSDPLVELTLRSKEDSALADPGAQVEFEVKLENKGTLDFPQGLLKLSTDNLTLLAAEVDGAPTSLQDGGAVIPLLAVGKAVTVRITAEMPNKPGDSARLTAMYTTPEGAPLTPLQSVILQVSDLSANVGCGSQPASLPGHLVSWFVLLLAASRPWERSRRLPHRERNGRQAPW